MALASRGIALSIPSCSAAPGGLPRRPCAMSHESEIQRAETLVDALPFIQQFRGQTFVIKYGGSAMEDEHLVERTLRDIVFLEAVGINP